VPCGQGAALTQPRARSIQTIARLPAVWRLLASDLDAMLVEDEQTARESLSALDAPGEDVESAVIAAANGRIVLSNRPEEIGSDVRLHEDFRAAVAEHRSSISGVSMSASGDHPVIFHSAPILDASGRVLGAVRLRSSVAAIEHVVQLAEDRTGAGAMGTLLDENGLVLIDSLMPDWLLRPTAPLSPDASARLAARGTWGDNPVPLPIGEADLRQAVGVQQPTLFDWRMDGTQFRSLARPLSRTPWSYVAALPVDTSPGNRAQHRGSGQGPELECDRRRRRNSRSARAAPRAWLRSWSGYLYARPLVAADLVGLLAQTFPWPVEHGFVERAAA
jgi:C4-dicarboxylate-specific signal transduction histidine kinase